MMLARVLCVVPWMAVLAMGCSDDPSASPALDAAAPDADAAAPDAAPTTCPPNSTTPCACATGIGVQRCYPDGTTKLACECLDAGLQIAVSPKGDDGAAGTLAAPFRTLDRAQVAVRAVVKNGLPQGGAIVWVRGGTYAMTKTLQLGKDDSGTASAKITWSGYPGESAHLVGGTAIDPSAFVTLTSASPVWNRVDASVRAKVVVADLKALGITDYGTLVSSGNDCDKGAKSSALELTIDGTEMPLARWPDEKENTDIAPDVNASSVRVYGSGLVPDVSGDYAKTGVVDGVSAFARTGLIGGKQYLLRRDTWTDVNGAHTAWFLTTTASGYPSNADPWFYLYSPTLESMSGANGATGSPSFRDPAAIHDGLALVEKDISSTQFRYANDRPSRWTQATDAWLHGLFIYGWAECHTKVATIDTGTKTLTVATAPGYGIGDQRPYYAENLLEEITTPGEWYIDRTSGKLYLNPPGALTGSSIVVSTLSTPILSLAGAANVTVRDLFIEDGRANLVEANASSHVRLVGLTLRNGGAAGASLNGTDIGVSYAHVYGTANEGIVIAGGDRPSLTRGDDFVENSNIHDFARWDWMYKAGVGLSGVGQHVSHNKIHGAPHNGILFFGTNDTTIELNEIYGVCTHAADAGAIYSGRDWGARGDVIHGNYLHDVQSSLTGIFAAPVVGIYLDDCLSGVAVTGNIIDRIHGLGIQHGGGRDDVMESNLLAHCDTALRTDARCVTWGAPGVGNLLGLLEGNNYQKEPWLSRYPACAAIPDDLGKINADGWALPGGSVFSRNAGFANGSWQVADDAFAIPAFKEIADDDPNATNVFVDESAGNMNVPSSSPVRKIPGFVVTPFDQVGIQPIQP